MTLSTNTTHTYDVTYWTKQGNTWVLQSSNPSKLVHVGKTYTDTVRRARPKDLFSNGTARTVTSIVGSRASMQFTLYYGANMYDDYPVPSMYSTNQQRLAGPYSWSPYLSEPSTSISRAAMYNSIRNSIRGEAVNLGNMLGEYGEIAKTFLDIAKTVTSRGRNLVRRHPSIRGAKSRVDYSSTVASAHLQWTYGLKPLAQDLGKAAAEIVSGVQVSPPYLEGTVRRKDRISSPGYRSSSSTVYTPLAYSEKIYETVAKTTWRAYPRTDSLTTVLAAHGLLNPLAVAWELMPYSFVIDWFLNVGDGLASLDNVLLFNDLVVIDSTSTRSFEYVRPMTNTQTIRREDYFEARRTDSRTAPTSISMIVTPQYKPSLSLGHFLNGAALLQMARGRLR